MKNLSKKPEKDLLKCVDAYKRKEKNESFSSKQEEYIANEEIIHEYLGNLINTIDIAPQTTISAQV